MLTTCHLEFQATATTALVLDDQAGAQLRGALVGALWERFCANKAAPSCPACPLIGVCPVAALVAPLRAEGETGGAQALRPYVLQPPPAARQYQPGDALAFRVSLFGPAAQLFPYVVLAAQELAEDGLGRRLQANGGQRGTLRLESLSAINPLSGTRQVLFLRGSPQVQTPGLVVTADDVAAAAAALPNDQLTLTFHTPLRLIERGQLVQRFALRPFVQRLKERVDQLAQTYGDGLALPRYDFADLLAPVQIASDSTRWLDVVSYSARQGRRLPIGGLVGTITLTGELAQPLRELLVWGALVHVGKNAVKGDGWYTLR
jgi:hypothetical protein